MNKAQAQKEASYWVGLLIKQRLDEGLTKPEIYTEEEWQYVLYEINKTYNRQKLRGEHAKANNEKL